MGLILQCDECKGIKQVEKRHIDSGCMADLCVICYIKWLRARADFLERNCCSKTDEQ